MKHTLLIDTSALLYKAKYSLGNKLSHKDIKTGILYGFLSQLQAVCSRYKTNRAIFALDSTESLRRNIFPGYKSKRAEKTEHEKKMDGICFNQFTNVIGLLKQFGFGSIHRFPGYEADDIIASALFQHPDIRQYAVIVSSDNDFYQLLDKCKGMYLSANGALYTKRHLFDEYGLEPKQWAQVKSISGCTSDTVPGVPGVGYKTAAKYLLGKASANQTEKIESAEMIPVRRLAKKLTNLPFDKKLIIPPHTPDKLDFDLFLNVCSSYGFNYIINTKEVYKSWERIFNGSFITNKEEKENKKRATFRKGNR